jgi:hypothetical protein
MKYRNEKAEPLQPGQIKNPSPKEVLCLF